LSSSSPDELASVNSPILAEEGGVFELNLPAELFTKPARERIAIDRSANGVFDAADRMPTESVVAASETPETYGADWIQQEIQLRMQPWRSSWLVMAMIKQRGRSTVVKRCPETVSNSELGNC